MKAFLLKIILLLIAASSFNSLADEKENKDFITKHKPELIQLLKEAKGIWVTKDKAKIINFLEAKINFVNAEQRQKSLESIKQHYEKESGESLTRWPPVTTPFSITLKTA